MLLWRIGVLHCGFMGERDVFILAGPNGAGKTTAAALVLPKHDLLEFVNADTIARGLSAFSPESVAIAAGRVMLDRLKELADGGHSFAFETTLSSRTFAPWLKKLRTRGYCVEIVFCWLPSAEMSINRVARRVRSGGHFVPDDTVRRRYAGGLRNFFRLYLPIADRWRFYDTTGAPRLIASSDGVVDPLTWDKLKQYGIESQGSENVDL